MGLFKESSKAYAIFNIKCPRCHKEDMFDTPTFSFQQPFEMRERCPHCNLDFFPQPGYYYGAMFISYIFTGFFCLGFIMFFHWVLDWSMGASFGLLISICAIFFVFVFRLARSIWININYSYDPSKAKA
ncbi:MAG: DUF983 domain-containing protein [Saprospiraceae bacterium]|nr:DUF983 domain-containing protein [Saprospiraceae bacterium]